MLDYLHKFAVLADIQVNILIHSHVLQPFSIIAQVNQLLNLSFAEMRPKVSLVFCEDFWLSLLSPQLMSKRRFNDNFLKNGSIVQSDGQCIRDSTHILIVVIHSKLRVLNASNLLTKRLNERRGSSLAAISVVGGLKTSVDEHNGTHVLDAVVAISEVVHRLELFVDNSDTGFVGPAGNRLDIGSGLALVCKLFVDSL